MILQAHSQFFLPRHAWCARGARTAMSSKKKRGKPFQKTDTYTNLALEYCDFYSKETSKKKNFISPKKYLPKARVLEGLFNTTSKRIWLHCTYVGHNSPDFPLLATFVLYGLYKRLNLIAWHCQLYQRHA